MSSQKFIESLQKLSREDLLEIILDQDPDIWKGIRRIEWVFENKLTHLTWDDGSPILGRPLSNEELALLIDEPFEPSLELTELGLDLEAQHNLHIAQDPVLWAKHYLKMKPRVYQILMMRYPSNRKVLRAGRRLGKTVTMAMLLLHYAFTHNNGRCIVVTPMKSQAELIYQELIMWATKSNIVNEAISRKVTSPQFVIEFSNGSTIRFFTSGIRSGGKADVVRGQEAHMIVLDELDYMHADDLESLYAMLQKTAEDQEDKFLIGASTPTGRREIFWNWCRSPRFKEFYYPSYCNPFFTQEMEDEFREEYSEMGYRHEIEADWGEDADGVYPRKYIDLAFSSGSRIAKPNTDSDGIKALSRWEYLEEKAAAKSFYIIGVDWDKYGAGTNIVVMEVCDKHHPDLRFQNKIRMAYREEVAKDEYTLTTAVDRIIDLNKAFDPKHIYVDRGYGEVQVELLHKHGLDHPESGLRKKVKGISFSETLEVRDPGTKEVVKKELKPFMVDNLRQMLEREDLVFSSHDEDLYIQLLSYIVVRTTQLGRPVFEASGNKGDHIHDAMLLACYAITKNYGDLLRVRRARFAKAISNEAFLPTFALSNETETKEDEIANIEQTWGSVAQAPVQIKRSMTAPLGKRKGNRGSSGYQRKMF